MIQQKPGVPNDGNNVPLPLTYDTPALAETNSSSLSSALTVTLNADTSMIEVNAIDQGIYLRWGAAPTSSAFDEFIQAGSTRHYKVAVNPSTGDRYTTVQFLQYAATATLIVIEK